MRLIPMPRPRPMPNLYPGKTDAFPLNIPPLGLEAFPYVKDKTQRKVDNSTWSLHSMQRYNLADLVQPSTHKQEYLNM